MTDISLDIRTPKPAFGKPTTHLTMGSQCPTCKGTGLMTPPITNGEMSAGKLAKVKCNNPACTVNRSKEKLGRNELNILTRKDIPLSNIKAVVSVMPAGRDHFEYNEVVMLADIKAVALLDEVWEAAHQRIDDYRKLALVSLDIDGHHYEFTSKDAPDCGRLTTERKPKDNPTMSPDEAELRAIKFDEEPKLSDVFKRDEPTPAPAKSVEQPKPDPVGALKMRLWNMIADVFGDKAKSVDENKPIISKHMMLALDADNFNDFILHHNPIEKATEIGVSMVDDYIQANSSQQPVAPAANVKDEPPSQTASVSNLPLSAPKHYDLNEAEIRAKYTIQMERFDKKQNRKIVTDYLQVAGRVLLFRLAHRDGNIKTTLINFDEKGALFRAEVFDASGKSLSASHAYTSSVGTEKFAGRYLEKAETSAIGRALAIAGFGTDAAGEDIDEEDQLSDSPVERKVA